MEPPDYLLSHFRLIVQKIYSSIDYSTLAQLCKCVLSFDEIIGQTVKLILHTKSTTMASYPIKVNYFNDFNKGSQGGKSKAC